jgi:hypothetical protein
LITWVKSNSTRVLTRSLVGKTVGRLEGKSKSIGDSVGTSDGISVGNSVGLEDKEPNALKPVAVKTKIKNIREKEEKINEITYE